MRISLAPVFAVSLAVLALPAPAPADTVYLTNGKSFEGVVADVQGSQVRIQMPGGELRLPKASVERVEAADSAYAEYLHRKQTLGRSANAAEWLALARWARTNGLDQGAREAALRAAHLDPHLDGLSSILRGYGYVYDRELDRYVTNDESMHRRGFVRSGGRWITREELAELRRASEESAAQRAAWEAAEASRAASDVQLQLAELQLYQQQAALESSGFAGYGPFGFTLGVFPGFFPPAGGSFHHGHGHGRGFPGSPRSTRSLGGGSIFRTPGMLGRVPGSLLPATPPVRRR